MPTTCQLQTKPSQEWAQSHVQYADGRNDGFVISDSGRVAMGYWDGGHLPFNYDPASRFPLADRWFGSCLGQTDPQRRFLIAATAAGQTDDIGTARATSCPTHPWARPRTARSSNAWPPARRDLHARGAPGAHVLERRSVRVG